MRVVLTSLHGTMPLSIARYGQKAALLSEAARAGYAVPEGFVLNEAEAESLLSGEPLVSQALQEAIEVLAGAPDARLAVRSSPAESLPGALLTQLKVEPVLESVLKAVRAVVASKDGASAEAQREARGLPHVRGSVAVLLQRQVQAREDDDFGAVVFTRDPERGTQGLLGEYQRAAGAEHVVSGRRVPLPLSLSSHQGPAARASSLQSVDPSAYAEITRLALDLEAHFGEPLELELVRAQGRLWLLQVRPLVMTARALVHVASEAIDADSPKFRVYAERLLALGLGGLVDREFSAPTDEVGDSAPLVRGLAASPGVAHGVVVTEPERALQRARLEPVILFRNHALPEDVAAFRASRAVVTTSGGLTCHAAVIARGLQVPAIVGCAEVRIDSAGGLVQARTHPEQILLREGEHVSVDARRGLVYRGERESYPRIVSPELRQLAQELRKLRPVALWAYGSPTASLHAKQDGTLDGIVCPISAPWGIAPATGRECWLELPARHAEAWLPHIPPGWGVVVRGDLDQIPFEILRRLARLTPLGVHLESEPDQTHISRVLEQGAARFDLAIVGPSVRAPERLSEFAPRLLLRADFDTDPARLRQPSIHGFLCETERSFEWMLRLALGLRPPTSTH